jgi:hypothetical protein
MTFAVYLSEVPDIDSGARPRGGNLSEDKMVFHCISYQNNFVHLENWLEQMRLLKDIQRDMKVLII